MAGTKIAAAAASAMAKGMTGTRKLPAAKNVAILVPRIEAGREDGPRAVALDPPGAPHRPGRRRRAAPGRDA